MIFYNLFFLMLLTFQIVDALPLHARRQRLHGQPCRQPDHLEGLFEDIIDRQHDHRIDRQIDRQPDEPPPGHGSDQPPTQLEPPQLPPSQPTIAHPQEATIRPLNFPISGMVTEICIITLIPLGGKFLEVKNCTLSSTPPDVSSSVTAESSYSSSASSTYVLSPSSVRTSSLAITTSSAPVSTYSSSVQTSSTEVPASSSSTSTSSSLVPTSISSVQTSSSLVPTFIPSVPTSSSSVLTTATIDPTSVDSSENDSSTSSATSISATSTTSISGTAAAAVATGDKTVPGRKLSVLPIGLGVFAGISVIALIVVGLVTYERTKYRKAFRKRKLAESRATIGFGGNAF